MSTDETSELAGVRVGDYVEFKRNGFLGSQFGRVRAFRKRGSKWYAHIVCLRHEYDSATTGNPVYGIVYAAWMRASQILKVRNDKAVKA